MHKQKGFTLVELLVVISIIGGLAALLLANFVGVRGRATDARSKANLDAVKKALRIYYNDYQAYPAASGGNIMGCGTGGDALCSPGGEFSAGAGGTIYMGNLPTDGYGYYSDGADEFLLVVELDNVSDEDIVAQQNRCDPGSRVYYSGSVDSDLYFVCED